MRASIFIFCITIILSLSTVAQQPQHEKIDFTQYVDPFIGTARMGHVFPGATVPFGMVQLSPETAYEPMFLPNGKYNKKTYAYCAGYQYADTTIIGFAHTHFSGTGHADLGDILIMPFYGQAGTSTPISSFSHNNEQASPGYYQVQLDSYDINVELTASERVGFHRYTFDSENNNTKKVLLDLKYGIYNYEGKNTQTFVRVENDSTITGYRQTDGWARNRTVYFTIVFSQPFTSYSCEREDNEPYTGFYRKFDMHQNFPEMFGEDLKITFDFDTTCDELLIKCALSPTSTNGATNNLTAEIPHWDFNQVTQEAKVRWNDELRKIRVRTIEEEQMTTFYTALYHTFLSPIVYEDVDGKYRGLDQNIHQSEGFTNYTIFSLWDTFRALHPLFNLVQPSRNNDMIKSMLAHQEQSVHKMLPIWSHYANENWCMIGYHAVPTIADAFVKNTTDVDINRALDACIATATVPYFDGLESYMNLGYVAEDHSSSSVSKTVEYAYDDWCISQLAAMANRTKEEVIFSQRAQNFEHLYDPNVGFMRPKNSNGEWLPTFDELNTHEPGFIEGNSWTYSLFVPHNPERLIEMMGGEALFATHLDSLFTMELDDKHIEKNEDITRDGIIGNYVQGNEPGHHIPYLYNWTTQPWKTQKWVRTIMETMYGNGPNGLCGNDDAGQMSAWYVFSALGFYPVCPGSPLYAVGSPLIESATIEFENGNLLEIETVNQSKKHIYVQNIVLNGTILETPFLSHQALIKGGKLLFIMGKKPVK